MRSWIRRGASKVMIGTQAKPEILRLFRREWTIARLDAIGRRVVVEGWRKEAGADVLYHLVARMLSAGVSLGNVQSELRARFKP